MTELGAVETSVTDLEIGMYVTALDRPWTETTFLVEGFYITSQEDIDELEKYCKYVYVDVYRSRAGSGRRSSRVVGAAVGQPRAVQQPPAPAELVQFRTGAGNVAETLFVHRKLKKYEDTTTFRQEMPAAKVACADLALAMSAMMQEFGRSGKVDLGGVRQALNPVVESMLRNPDACVWLARGGSEATYASGHPVGAAIWSAALGRNLGLPLVDIQRMATGALVFDIGKLRVPRELLLKRERLSREEFQQVKNHVLYGMEMLKDSGVLNRTVSDMVEYHHERFGGHGYPRGLQGDAIPVFGRIAAIVDCFDAITSKRPYSAPMSPSHAVKKMYAWRNVDFQAELVEEFIQTIGSYPAGTLVELSNGEVGVVLAGYRTRRLRPELLIVLDREKRPLKEPRELDLKLATQDDDGKTLEIATSLEPGSFGVELDRLYR